MRLDIHIDTEVLSPHIREGTYHATWYGFSDAGRLLGSDGVTETACDSQYGMLVRALCEAAGHINKRAAPEVHIYIPQALMYQSAKRLSIWAKRDYRKSNGREVSHAVQWRKIAEKLRGLNYIVEVEHDGKRP
jgi:hypothetical protein